MTKDKELTKEYFNKFLEDFSGDLRNSIEDIMKDMENYLSFMTDETEKDHAIQSALTGMLSVQMGIFMASYKTDQRKELLVDIFAHIENMSTTIREEITGEDDE